MRTNGNLLFFFFFLIFNLSESYSASRLHNALRMMPLLPKNFDQLNTKTQELKSCEVNDNGKVDIKFIRKHKCILKFMNYLHLNFYMPSDPKIIRSILTDDMYLGDFEKINTLFKNELTRPVSFFAMTEQVVTAIMNLHPSILTFICRIMRDSSLLPQRPNYDAISRVLHHTYILNKLVKEFLINPELARDVDRYLLNLRQEKGHYVADSMFANLKELTPLLGLFGAIKTVSIDSAMLGYGEIRNKENKTIPASSVRNNKLGVTLNVLEATFTDLFCGFFANVCPGLQLALHPPQNYRFHEDNKKLLYEVSQNWMSLYETWNLAFITGNLPNLDLLYPKLLIPEVIASRPNEYIFPRVLALSLSIHFYILRKLEGRPDVILPHSRELAELWGKINYELNYDKEL